MMFVVFACTQDCLNCGESDKKSNEDSNLEKRLTTLQDVVDNANAGEEIDLSDYELTSYTATVNKKLTIKNGSLKNATLIITSENVKLEKLTDLSVATSSSRLTINDSKLSDLLIGNATSESRATAVDIAIAMVSVAGCEIENVELNGFNSQLNITDVKTKINDIMTSTKVKVILEAGSYEGMKDPVVENNGELTRIDMTKEKTLSVLSIYSHPTKAEYQIDEKLDTTGLIVMGTYTASVEIFKSGGWKGEAVDSVTKWEDKKDYTITCEDFSTAGVKIVTITSNVDTKVKCNFYVYVKDAQIKEPEITDITLKSLGEPKTLYRVGEKLDLSWVQLVGTYNGLEINLPYTSEPVNGGQLTTENTQITFYYNGEIISTKEITVTEPCEVEFYDGIGESSLLYMLEMADGESLRLPVDPQRGNYTFAGWYNGDEKIESGYKVTSTLKLTARWNTKNYTVIFYANDTSDKIIKQTFVLDVEQALMKNSFIREGYTFVGWAKNGFGEKVYDDCAIVKNLTDKVNDEVTLYAKWDVNTYTVKFNANGGSGEMADMSFNYNEEKALTVNTFTRKDYTFAGWATSADGDVIYADEQNVKNLTAENKATVTLYAVWTEKDKVLSVRFSMPSETAIDCGSSVTLLCNTEGAKISYTIDGVTKEYSDAIVITEDVTITAFATKDGMKNSDITTASYTVKTYTVTYKSDYDTVPSDVVGLKKDDKLTAEQLPELTRTGYTFAGWYNGENEVTTEYKITNDLELTATWTANKYTVIFNSNYNAEITDVQDFTYDIEENLKKDVFIRTDGYTFAGWATSDDGGIVYNDGEPVLNLASENNATVTLYAVWKNNNACYVSYNDSPENQYFKIIQDAVDFVIEKNNGNQEFTIYVMSDVINEADVSNNAFININPANALKLKICSSDSEIKTINAGGKSRVMYIGNTNSDSTVKTTVILEDIILTGGKSSTGSGVYVEKGGSFSMTGGTYVANSNNVYLANGTTITVMGELTGATTFATITPSSYSEGTQVLKAGDASINLLNYVSKFKLSDSNWSIDVDGKIYDKTTVTLGAIVYSDKTVSRFYHQTKTMIGYVIAIENGKATKIVSVDETDTNWDEAKTWCDNYGDKSGNKNWTLPTKKNLKLVFEAKDEINKSIERIIAGGGDASKLSDKHYWSSEISTVYEAYAQDFSLGNFFANARSKTLYCLVRAVRDF